jgi:hypothetical protein
VKFKHYTQAHQKLIGIQKRYRWLAGLAQRGEQEAIQRVFPAAATIDEVQL